MVRRIVISLLLVFCLTLAFAAPAFAQELPPQGVNGVETALIHVIEQDTPAQPVLEGLIPTP